MMADSVNVCVAVRARPINGRERELGCKECVTMKGKVTTVVDESGVPKDFGFDYSYWYNTKQETVYNDLAKPIVAGAIDGFNGTIFAYGQTGSGKSHTMHGTGDDVGIIPLMNRELFDLLEAKKKAENCEFLVTASYMEIYNEVLRDLLNPSDKQLKIREHPKLGVYVEHLAQLVVEDAKSISELLEQGDKVKQVASTHMNERSSRSHCCFVVNIKQRKVEEIGSGDEAMKRETTLTAQINLVDLAGSERASKTGAKGDRLKEGAAINQSLSTLGQVINMLAEGATGHIPYRNSKLTRVLQQALGGNARTVMVATISPADNNYQETLSTLQYASRAKKITNATTRNEDVNQKLIRELREEVERLRQQMAEMQQNQGVLSPTSSSELENERLKQMQEKISLLEETKRRQWEEVENLSKAFEEERKKILTNDNAVRSIMQNVKEEKVNIMKKITALANEKAELTKQMKKTKANYQTTRETLENAMKEYQSIVQSGKPIDESSPEIQTLLGTIETNRKKLVEQRTKMKDVKESLKRNQEQQLEHKAEMEAQKQLLEQDAELRKAIQDEERNKFQAELQGTKEEYLKSELDQERNRMEGKVFDEIKKIEENYKRKLLESKAREKQLEDKLFVMEIQNIDDACEKQLLRKEINRLQNQLKSKDEKYKSKFVQLKQQFEKAVIEMENVYRKDQLKISKALAQATEDCVDLYEKNISLQAGT